MENEEPVCGSVLNTAADLSKVLPTEQDESGASLPESHLSANLGCSNEECRKREEKIKPLNEIIKQLNEELSEVKKKLQESEKQGHKMTAFIHNWLLHEKFVLEKKVESLEAKLLEQDVTDGVKWLELKDEDIRRILTHFPFNCDSSCALCVVFFIFYQMKINICPQWFLVKLRITTAKKLGENVEIGECFWSLKYLHMLCLIEEKPFFSKPNIDVEEIDGVFKDVKTTMQTHKYPALLAVKYGEQSMPWHCLAIMPTTVDSKHVQIYDVQKSEQWHMNCKKVKSITEIELYKIDKEEAKAWEFEYISTASCKVCFGTNSDNGLE